MRIASKIDPPGGRQVAVSADEAGVLANDLLLGEDLHKLDVSTGNSII